MQSILCWPTHFGKYIRAMYRKNMRKISLVQLRIPM